MKKNKKMTNALDSNMTIIVGMFTKDEVVKFEDIKKDKNFTTACTFSCGNVDDTEGFPECYHGLSYGIFLFEGLYKDFEMQKFLWNHNISYKVLLTGKADGETFKLFIDDLVNGVSTNDLQDVNFDSEKFNVAKETFMAVAGYVLQNIESIREAKAQTLEASKSAIQQTRCDTISEDDRKLVAKKVQDSLQVTITHQRVSVKLKPIEYSPDYLKFLDNLGDDAETTISVDDIDGCLAYINVPALFVVDEVSRAKVVDILVERTQKYYAEKLFELGLLEKNLIKGSAA